MANSIKVNFALDPETVHGIEKLGKETHRGKSDVIDWLVSDEIARRAILSTPENGQYVNGKQVVMVKHADGRIEITPEFAATGEGKQS